MSGEAVLLFKDRILQVDWLGLLGRAVCTATAVLNNDSVRGRCLGDSPAMDQS